jgi:hypothetical protein
MDSPSLDEFTSLYSVISAFHSGYQNHRMLFEMANTDKAGAPIKSTASYLALKPGAIEKVFIDCAMDWKQILVLDGIDMLLNGFRIRSHDLHGQLPEITMKNSGDIFRDKNALGDEVCKLIAIVRLRDEMVRFQLGRKLLAPTSVDGKAIAGLQAKPLIWLGESADFLAAYHDLRRQVVG